MKRAGFFLVATFCVALLSTSAFAQQVLLTEDFNYPASDLITAHGWAAHSGGGTNAITVTSPALSYPNYFPSGVGNAISMTTSGEDDNKPFVTQSSGTVYAACLANVSASQLTGDYFFHLFQTSAIFYGRLYVKKDPSSTNYAFGIAKSNGAVNYTGFTFAPNTTHLLIVKYTFVGAVGTDDTVNLIIDPVVGQPEPAPTIGALDNANADSTGLLAIAVRQGAAGNAATVRVDGIRVANTFPVAAPTAADSRVSGNLKDVDGAPIAGAVIRMNGTQSRKTITDAEGNYNFDDVETNGFYTVRPSAANFSFSPGERSFSQLGNTTEATFTGSRSGNQNPIDTPEYFVRQHYLDFLGREPDESGFNFWSDQILGCANDADCIERRTINVSAAYFLSGEFQQTGALVDRLYRASYGRSPSYSEFVPDRSAIAHGVVVGRDGWQQQLAANQESFVNAWTDRAAFHAAYDGLSSSDFVDALISQTGVSFAPTERDSIVSGLSAGTLSRAQALQQIAANENFARARFNEAFVMMQYFGYLQRDPDSSGYNFWLNKLNQFDGNFERAEMVKAFLVSGEYRARFR